MVLPTPDESAYDGNIIVKRTTYGKSKTVKASGLAKVRKVIAALEEEADRRVTIDRLDSNDPLYSLEVQVTANKVIAAELRKQALFLKTFLKNNS